MLAKKSLLRNKRALFLIIGLGLILSFIPSQLILAQQPVPCSGCGILPWQWPACIQCITNYLPSLPIRLPFFLIAIILGGIGLVTGAIFSLIITLLNWLKSFILSVPITSGGIVDIGWSFARDFVNMFFIVVLVFIGLATILKLRDYEAKKTLPKLILVVLLINFTPVIVGFIVDVANLFTNFFLTKAGDAISLDNVFQQAVDYIVNAFTTIFFINGEFFNHLLSNYDSSPAIIGVFIGIIVYGFALTIFYGLAAVIYLIVFLILFVRIIFLWILMILAPIAFLSLALPPSKTVKALLPSILHWDEWWEKLIQWSIVGIPLGFFLYLSNWIMNNQSVMSGLLNPPPPIADLTAPGTNVTIALASGGGIIANMLIPLMGIILLGFGAMVSIQASGTGAKQIIEWAQKGGKVAAGYAAGAMRRIPQISRAEETIRRRMETVPGLGRLLGGPGAFEAERKSKMEVATKAIERIPDTFRGNKDILARISQPALSERERLERAAAIEVLAKRKALDLTDEQAKRFLPEAQQLGANISAIYKARPDYAQYLTTIDPTTKKPKLMDIDEVMAKIEPYEFYKTVQKEAFKNADVVFQAAMDERKFQQMTRHLKTESKREYKNAFIAAPPRPLTPQQSAMMKKRIYHLSTEPEWQV